MKKFILSLFVLSACISQIAFFNLTNAAVLGDRVESPSGAAAGITCDFSGLYEEIFDLNLDQFTGPNDRVRAARKRILLEHVETARAAAQDNNLERVITELSAVLSKVNGGKNDWVLQGPAIDITQEIEDLLLCLAANPGSDDHDN